jgi:hypothetical protein
MGVNFREALATLSRALPVVLFRAGIFVAGGFMVIIIFGMLLFALRLAGSANQGVVIVVAVTVVLGWLVSGLVLQRFFFYRYRAAMLLLFSGRSLPVSGLAAVIREAGRFFPNYSRWAVVNRGLRRALSALYPGSGEYPELPVPAANRSFSGAIDLLAKRQISQAILVLAFSRGSNDPGRSELEGLSLYFRHGHESRRLARHWLWFSAAGLAFVFLCLALPNWFIFRSAGAPVRIGFILAATIAWLLYQAFLVPLVLSGISGRLLAETCGKTPDPDLCKTLSFMVPDMVVPDKKGDND